MTGFRPLIVFVLVSLSGAAFREEDGELKAVVVMFRHGDRAPINTWPNDEYFGDSSLWPDGYGQLNNMGKQRQYQLGQWFRERYDGFLPTRYNRSDIYVRSTDVDRTLMSAAYNLAGLYPPSGDQIWNENIPWQAIPIHTTPVDKDADLAGGVPCPKHDRLREELLNSPEFQQFNQEHAELFRNISELTGFPVDEVDVGTFSGLFSTITIYRGFNLTLPDWTEVYWPEIQTLAALSFQINTYTPDLARLKAGPFISYLIDHINAFRNQNSRKLRDEDVRKFLMLSAHDSTVSDDTNAMGVYPSAVPGFASSVIWEVKCKNGKDDDLYINMYFKNSTQLSQLTIPGCEFDCDIDDFVEILKPVTVSIDQWTQECYENI